MDSVRRFIFEALDIRGAVVLLGNAWHEMQAGRNDPPCIAALLGEIAAITVLIAGNLKAPGRLTFQLQGQGLVSLLLVDCDEQLRLRGTARYADAVPPAPTFQDLLGDGQLVLTLHTNAGDPYQSIVPLVGDSVTAVFEHYLAQSEQQAAKLFLTASEDFAAGLFLQKLPDADVKDPDGWNRIGHLAATLKPAELRQPVANLLMQVFPEEDVRLFDPRPVRYHCPRDEEKVLSMLKSLGREEIEATLAEAGAITVDDDICRQQYQFGPELIQRLFD
ncbi:MAG: Hsp33 family molecular chaperone HslO [Rhodocyclaceae bacterium]|nr:Hsp33 family molecular chaperone HslO [Rhodocyclaceae bacterium]MDZ4213723.1 Hsp33 family molecular chaperone HslO [Rhodocyclaceae bacterium]